MMVNDGYWWLKVVKSIHETTISPYQWIGLRENLQETHGFYHQIGWAFRFQFSHHPILRYPGTHGEKYEEIISILLVVPGCLSHGKIWAETGFLIGFLINIGALESLKPSTLWWTNIAIENGHL